MSGSIIVSGASLKPDDSAADDSSTDGSSTDGSSIDGSSTSSSIEGPDGPATVSFSYSKQISYQNSRCNVFI